MSHCVLKCPRCLIAESAVRNMIAASVPNVSRSVPDVPLKKSNSVASSQKLSQCVPLCPEVSWMSYCRKRSPQYDHSQCPKCVSCGVLDVPLKKSNSVASSQKLSQCVPLCPEVSWMSYCRKHSLQYDHSKCPQWVAGCPIVRRESKQSNPYHPNPQDG